MISASPLRMLTSRDASILRNSGPEVFGESLEFSGVKNVWNIVAVDLAEGYRV